MYRRSYFNSCLLLVVGGLGLVGCGGDDGGSAAASGGSCTAPKPASPAIPATATTPAMPATAAIPAQQSVPGMPGDPCPQNNPMCLPPAKGAVTTCGTNGKWLTSTGAACQCISLTCGNGVLDPGENCDPKLAVAATCTSLGKGTGVVSCDPKTCMYNVTMCVGSSSMGGTGGAGM